MAWHNITLVGGPLDEQVSELWDPSDRIDAGDGDGAYVKDPADPTRYVWTEGARPAPDPDDPLYVAPLPDSVRLHLQHLRDYLAKDNAAITTTETVHVVKDLIRAVHHLNRRFETEG